MTFHGLLFYEVEAALAFCGEAVEAESDYFFGKLFYFFYGHVGFTGVGFDEDEVTFLKGGADGWVVEDDLFFGAFAVEFKEVNFLQVVFFEEGVEGFGFYFKPSALTYAVGGGVFGCFEKGYHTVFVVDNAFVNDGIIAQLCEQVLCYQYVVGAGFYAVEFPLLAFEVEGEEAYVHAYVYYYGIIGYGGKDFIEPVAVVYFVVEDVFGEGTGFVVVVGEAVAD